MLDRWARAALAASLVGVCTLGASASAHAATVSVGTLRMDNRTDQPLGVDDATPTFTWQLSGAGAKACPLQLLRLVQSGDGREVIIRSLGPTNRRTPLALPLTFHWPSWTR